MTEAEGCGFPGEGRGQHHPGEAGQGRSRAESAEFAAAADTQPRKGEGLNEMSEQVVAKQLLLKRSQGEKEPEEIR